MHNCTRGTLLTWQPCGVYTWHNLWRSCVIIYMENVFMHIYFLWYSCGWRLLMVILLSKFWMYWCAHIEGCGRTRLVVLLCPRRIEHVLGCPIWCLSYYALVTRVWCAEQECFKPYTQQWLPGILPWASNMLHKQQSPLG